MANRDEIENKVVLIGESTVGKTCIILQFIDGRFKANSLSTLSAQFCRKNFEFPENKRIALDIWDTVGQEKFRSLNKIFYSNARAVILVYDITNKKSFDEIKNYWYGQIKQNCENDLIIAIAANKSDLSDQREVPDEEGEEFANSIHAIFSSTYAKDNTGITNLFETIAKKMLEPDFIFNTNKTVRIQKKKNVIQKQRQCC